MNCRVWRQGGQSVNMISIITTLPAYCGILMVLPSLVTMGTSAHLRGVCCAKHNGTKHRKARRGRKINIRFLSGSLSILIDFRLPPANPGASEPHADGFHRVVR